MARDNGQEHARPTLQDRIAARWAGWRAAPAQLALRPEPRSIGRAAHGTALCAGRYRFAGHVVEGGQASLWSVSADGNAGFDAARHGFIWLDDLAALGSAPAQARARSWTLGWIDRYGRGTGPGWTADLAGRRLIRILHHLTWMSGSADPDRLDARLATTLDHHLRYLARRARHAPPGLPRIEALGGLVIGALTLADRERLAEPALAAFETACRQEPTASGAVADRNPQHLLALFEVLVWADRALSERGRLTRPAHQAAMETAAQTLRALRHSDGSLARFHGGGRGVPGALESALALADIRPATATGLAMGYARLTRGRSSVIVDASPPPMGPAGRRAHASTLAFELTSGRRPLIVNCGAGHSFGSEWDRAARATPSHSTLGLDGMSSARLGAESRTRTRLVSGPRDVPVELDLAPGPASLVAAHDGYVESYGLIHARRLDLGTDGRALAGEDILSAPGEGEQRRFARALERAIRGGVGGIAYTIRFHIHPEVTARLEAAERAVRLTLPSGDVWIFRHASPARMSLDPSVYLENTRTTPVATVQIVLAGKARTPETAVKWSLAKAEEGPAHARDLGPDPVD